VRRELFHAISRRIGCWRTKVTRRKDVPGEKIRVLSKVGSKDFERKEQQHVIGLTGVFARILPVYEPLEPSKRILKKKGPFIPDHRSV